MILPHPRLHRKSNNSAHPQRRIRQMICLPLPWNMTAGFAVLVLVVILMRGPPNHDDKITTAAVAAAATTLPVVRFRSRDDDRQLHEKEKENDMGDDDDDEATTANGGSYREVRRAQQRQPQPFSGDGSGPTAVISGDGTIVAMRMYFGDDDESSITFHSLVDSSLFFEAEDIRGRSDEDFSGRSMALSNDGRTVAVAFSGRGDSGSSISNFSEKPNIGSNGTTTTTVGSDGGGNNLTASGTNGNHGYVRVFQYNESTNAWPPLGADLTAGAQVDSFGGDVADVTVSISGDGSIVALGAKQSDPKGRVRVFQFVGNQTGWARLGNDVDGGRVGDQFGHSVSLSRDGRTVAVLADIDSGRYSHIVKVFRYSPLAANGWMQVGSDIEVKGEENIQEAGLSGRSVSLSADGSTVAVGSIRNFFDENASAAFVFTLTPDNEWAQLGNPIGRGYSGFSTSLSEDGRTIAVGTVRFNDISGYARIYRYDPSLDDWEAGMFRDDSRDPVWEVAGFSVALSNAGNVVVVAGQSPFSAGGEIYAYVLDDETFSNRTAAPGVSPDSENLDSSPTSSPTTTSDNNRSPSSRSAVSPVSSEASDLTFLVILTIIGIVLGVLAVTSALGLAVFWCYKKYSTRPNDDQEEDLPVAAPVNLTQSYLVMRTRSAVAAQVFPQSATASHALPGTFSAIPAPNISELSSIGRSRSSRGSTYRRPRAHSA